MTELSTTYSAPLDPPANPPANGPALSEAEFVDLLTQLRGWSEGESADERGTLAAVGPDTVQAALAVPRLGRTVSLALPINRASGPDNARPALHHMVDLGDVEAPEPSAHKDFLGLDYHGKAVTHLDAICHIAYRGALFGASAGLHVDAMPLLAERQIVLLDGDGDSDVRPSPVTGVHSPIHALALTAMGMPLLDNLDLEEPSVACAEAGRYEFLLVVAPLVVPRGTGSPVNPIAIL